MEKKFENGDFAIVIDEDSVTIMKNMMNGYANCIYDVYCFDKNGVIRKYEKSAGWSRNNYLAGGGMNCNILTWRKRLGWKDLKNELMKAEDFHKAIELIRGIDKDVLFNEAS